MSAQRPDLITAPRTCYCGEPRRNRLGQKLVIKGWAHHNRDHGGVIFVDLRDRTGVTQVVFNPDDLSPEDFARAQSIRAEFVLAVEGDLIERSAETVNSKLPTGEVEIRVKHFEILNVSKPPPFKLDEYGLVGEETRLKYRYLDLRRPEMQANIVARHKYFQAVRNFLSDEGFLEIETPCLTKATPEGARDFLVPSRLHPGKFYALPQSPQIYKQILMVAGYDRYFQLARCFRDEDLRANRTLEFTQIDIEASFTQPEELYGIVERMMQRLFRDVRGEEMPMPIPRLTWHEAMLSYGSDKPDLRFDLKIKDVSACFAEGSEFKVFNSVLQTGGTIRGLRVPGGATLYSNTQLKPEGEVNRHAQVFGAKGVAWFRVDDSGALESNIAKFFDAGCQARLIETLGAGAGDLILLVADKPLTAADAMGQLRLKVARDSNLIDKTKFALVWVTDFPLFGWNEREKRWDPSHHPFTAPNAEDMQYLESEPGRVRSVAYDLAMNGEEIGGGSQRIHRADVQAQVFKAIGLSLEEAQEKFGFLLDALQYGAPPHGGIAFGVDRMLALLLGEDSNRQVIPFPTNQSGIDMMSGAPTRIAPKQLDEVFIASTFKEEEEKPAGQSA